MTCPSKCSSSGCSGCPCKKCPLLKILVIVAALVLLFLGIKAFGQFGYENLRGGGGGGSSSLAIDHCPDGDNTASYYDNSCESGVLITDGGVEVIEETGISGFLNRLFGSTTDTRIGNVSDVSNVDSLSSVARVETLELVKVSTDNKIVDVIQERKDAIANASIPKVEDFNLPAVLPKTGS